jgi:hypothetical protein
MGTEIKTGRTTERKKITHWKFDDCQKLKNLKYKAKVNYFFSNLTPTFNNARLAFLLFPFLVCFVELCESSMLLAKTRPMQSKIKIIDPEKQYYFNYIIKQILFLYIVKFYMFK